MEFDAVVRKRKSVRSFSGKKVRWKDVLNAIDSSIKGPFAGNYNHLRFIILEDRGKIEEIAEICEQDWISQCGILVVICSDDSHLEDVYGERGRVYSRQQAGASVQALLFKLTDIGLDSCWVGAYDDDAIRKLLGVPSSVQIEAVVPVGYGDGKSKGKRKKALENVLYWGKWGKNRRPTIFGGK